MSQDASAVDTAVALMELQAELALKHGLNVPKRSFWINGTIDMKMLKHVDACLGLLEHQNSKHITIKLSSLGGECYSALAIVSVLKKSKCKVHIEAHGAIMSAATLILAAGDKRSISRYASFMLHESSYTVGGRHSEVQAWVEQFEKEEDVWAAWMSKLSGTDQDYWKNLGKHVDKFLTPEQLKELGVVDSIF